MSMTHDTCMVSHVLGPFCLPDRASGRLKSSEAIERFSGVKGINGIVAYMFVTDKRGIFHATACVKAGSSSSVTSDSLDLLKVEISVA